MGLTQEAMGHLAEAVGTQENHLTLANKENHLSSRVQALSSLGRLHFHLGQIDASVSYLEQALAATEGTEQRADEAVIRYRYVCINDVKSEKLPNKYSLVYIVCFFLLL